MSALIMSSFGMAFLAAAPLASATVVNPASPTTNAATSITSTDATLNGTNGNTNATDSSFWVSTSTFSTASATLPSGVYSTTDLGPVGSSTAYSAALSSVSGILPVTSGTTYYVAAWSSVDGGTTWNPGAVVSFTTTSAPTITNIAPASGSTAGGTSITITGTEFANGATVTVGGASATGITVVGSTSITAITPAGAAGPQDVIVTNTDGGTVTSTGGFTYVTSVVGTNPTTLPATAITSGDATLNGLNGDTDATDSSFWVSTSPFSTASPTLPSGVYSTADLGAVSSSTTYSAALSSVSGILPVTPSTTYYFAAWTEVGGTWYPGAVLQFSTSGTSTAAEPTVSSISPAVGTTTGGTVVTITGTDFIGATAVAFGTTSATSFSVVNNTSITATSPAGAGTVDVTVTTPLGTSATSSADHFTYTLSGIVTGGGVLHVDSINSVKTNATADGTYANGWVYVFNITIPTNETNLSMMFSDWTGTGTIPAGGNMQISSAQANNGGAQVPITAANTYSTPPLVMTGDLDPATPGLQVQVTVDVAVPIGTANGSYSTNYGVQTN